MISTRPETVFRENSPLQRLDQKKPVIIIGRGHSGTRLLPRALQKAGMYLGEPLNEALDLLPTGDIYKACRIAGKHVRYKGAFEWDFSQVCEMEIPGPFIQLLENYLRPLIQSEEGWVGWKIPNNTLIYPWLTRLLPNAVFIFWVRHPEGSCSSLTGVDRLEKWGIPCKKFWFHEWNYKLRAASWKYHCDIVMQTPRPAHFLTIRYEDYILDQEHTRKRIEALIGMELPAMELHRGKAGPYSGKYRRKFPFLTGVMDELGYDQ